MNFGGWEMILIVAVLFLLFGASRLPQLAKSIGQSRKAFKDGMREAEEEAQIEEEQKRRIGSNSAAASPQLTELSDDDLLEEARRRAALKQQS